MICPEGSDPNTHGEEQFQEEGDPQPIVVQAKFTVQVSRALGSWKKHQTAVSVVQSLPSSSQFQQSPPTSAGTSEAASQDVQPRQGSSIMPTISETPTEGALVFGPYLTQFPPAQVARAY